MQSVTSSAGEGPRDNWIASLDCDGPRDHSMIPQTTSSPDVPTEAGLTMELSQY